MDKHLKIAVFIDFDNIEIGVKSTLQREFDVSIVLEALKERGEIVTKIAYANWGRLENSTRQLSEYAVQMVQRDPSPRGDKNGADINLALDALEMAFTHAHINAFAIISGDSDFIALVNKLKQYDRTVFVVGGKAFTSTILQQNCHEFISFESLMQDAPERPVTLPGEIRAPRGPEVRQGDRPPERLGDRPDRGPRPDRGQDRGRQRPAPLDLQQAIPLVERALQVLERRAVQPQLGLLKSTMLQLDPAFNERAYGASSFSDFVEKLKKADYVNVSGQGGRYIIERKTSTQPERPTPKPEEALPALRDVLETHRLEMENGAPVDDLSAWVQAEVPNFEPGAYGFQEFSEFLNYAQDKLVVRVEPDEEKGLVVYLGAEFYPPAVPEPPVEQQIEEEEDEKQPIVEGQPSLLEPNPPPVKPKPIRRPRKVAASGNSGDRPPRRSRKKKPEPHHTMQ